MLMIEQLICAGAFATSGIFALYLFRTRLEFPEILGAWMMVAAGAWVAVFAMTAPWLILRNPMRLAKDR